MKKRSNNQATTTRKKSKSKYTEEEEDSDVASEVSTVILSDIEEAPQSEVATVILSEHDDETTDLEFQEFISIFPDFIEFMAFVDGDVCSMSFDDSDFFCQIMKSHQINNEFFTTNAPEGYSLYALGVDTIRSSQTPFLYAMKYIFTIIPHFNPSITRITGKLTVHLYMIVLDRLIYYYQIYILINENKLQGFSNTAGIMIYTHGIYRSYNVNDPINVRELPESIENLFICTKSSPGCTTSDVGKYIFEDVENTDSSLWVMTNHLLEKKYVNFDDTVFRSKPCSRILTANDAITANCYIEDEKPGRPMQNYISPNTKKYINKFYEGRTTDNKCYVIDLNKFYEVRDLEIPVKEKIRISTITNHDFMQERMSFSRNSFYFYLNDIIDYCSQVLHKQNVFIYDRSCGTVKIRSIVDGKVVYSNMELDAVILATEEFARSGFGIPKKRIRRKRGSKRLKRNKRSRKTRKIKK